MNSGHREINRLISIALAIRRGILENGRESMVLSHIKVNILIGLVLLALLPTALFGLSGEVVQARIITDKSEVSPGASFFAGVLFSIKPGWHIYWKNPGDSGLATNVRFEAPESVEIGEVLWPLPDKFIQPGNFVGYGYHDQLLLFAEVHVPEGAVPGSEIGVVAKADWLGCEKICVRGKKDLTIGVAVGSSKVGEHTETFELWNERIPALLTPKTPLKVVTRGTLSSKESPFSVELIWNANVTDLEWFPSQVSGLIIKAPLVQHSNNRSEIQFQSKWSNPKKSPPRSFESVIAYVRDGERHGIILPVALK